VGAPRPLYASGTDSLGKPAQPSDPVAAFMGMGVHQNAKCNCSTTRAGFHRLDRTSLSRRPTVTVNPVTGSAGRDQGL